MLYDKFLLPVSPSCKLQSAQRTLKLPKKPLYNQPGKAMEVFKLMRLALDKLNLVGRPLSTKNLVEIARAAAKVTGCKAEIARNLLQPFNSCYINKRTQDIMCWQVAGNRKRMNNLQPHVYNSATFNLSWMFGVIAEYVSEDTSKIGAYRVRIIDGPAAGLDMFMPAPKRIKLMSDVLGATYKIDKDKMQLSDYRQAVQMQVAVYPEQLDIVQFTSGAGNINFKHLTKVNSIAALKTTAKQRKNNLELVKTRNKLCQFGFRHPCHICKIGYDECSRGCLPRSIKDVKENVILLIKGKNICQKTLEEA